MAAPQARQMNEDQFADLYGEDIISPPYNLIELKTIAEYSTILQQCIDAYRVNITGFGFDVEYTFDVNSSDCSPTKRRGPKNWMKLESFYKCLHFDESAETILGYAIEDREKRATVFSKCFGTGRENRRGLNIWM